jgi:hypothetical protein
VIFLQRFYQLVVVGQVEFDLRLSQDRIEHCGTSGAARDCMKGVSRRFVRLEDVGAASVFLRGPAARDITGAMIPIDAGRRPKPAR